MSVVKLFKTKSVADALAEHGLPDEAVLKQSLIAGYLAKSACTPLDAPNFASFLQWNTVVKTLRELTIVLGWKTVNEGMYALTVNPEGGKAIVVSTGDEFTGIDGLQLPTTKSRKGPKTVNAVLQNAAMCWELFEETLPDITEVEQAGRQTWILLFNTKGGVLHAELSLPGSIKEGHIDAWQHRIILSESPLRGSLDLPET
ncbi:MAG: hypothetical protein WAZ18_07670, partial [Alphaproteobacteria bacterium]